MKGVVVDRDSSGDAQKQQAICSISVKKKTLERYEINKGAVRMATLIRDFLVERGFGELGIPRN